MAYIMSLFTYRHRATVEDCLNHPWIQVSVFIGCAVRMILLHGFEYIPLVATHHISVLLRSWVGRGRLFNGTPTVRVRLYQMYQTTETKKEHHSSSHQTHFINNDGIALKK